MITRRKFMRGAALLTGGVAIAPQLRGLGDPVSGTAGTLDERDDRVDSIRLLILGGTGFIGPYQVRYALERGHQVTIFNRGRSAPGLFPGVEELVGDRATGDLSALEGRSWDAVIDNSASTSDAPTWVRDAGRVLGDRVGQYLYISTRSVYADLSAVPATVDAPLRTRENTPNWQEGQPYPYGLAKALAEGEARAAFGSRTTIVRPGLIVGPGDETDRFTYWPVRIERGGEILAPGDPHADRVQVIDVRDLCEWAVRLCEVHTFGTFMGVGPENGRSMSELLYGIASVVSTPLTWTWVPREFLAEQGFRPYQEMPVWRPPTPGQEGFSRFDLSREVAAGLTFRTLAETAKDTLAYHHSRDDARKAVLRAGATAEQEVEVLRAWHQSARSRRNLNPERRRIEPADALSWGTPSASA
jgi:2'-hydroxyisoflavone reductase